MANQKNAATQLQEIAKDFEFSSTAEVVDHFGQLKAELAAAEEAVQRLKQELSPIEELLTEITDQEPADEKVTLTGEEYEVDFGIKSTRVVDIDKEAVFNIIGPKAWYELTMPLIGDLRKYLNPPQVEAHIKEERSGKRRATVKEL